MQWVMMLTHVNCCLIIQGEVLTTASQLLPVYHEQVNHFKMRDDIQSYHLGGMVCMRFTCHVGVSSAGVDSLCTHAIAPSHPAK